MDVRLGNKEGKIFFSLFIGEIEGIFEWSEKWTPAKKGGLLPSIWWIGK
jgi:hypothetical protein